MGWVPCDKYGNVISQPKYGPEGMVKHDPFQFLTDFVSGKIYSDHKLFRIYVSKEEWTCRWVLRVGLTDPQRRSCSIDLVQKMYKRKASEQRQAMKVFLKLLRQENRPDWRPTEAIPEDVYAL